MHVQASRAGHLVWSYPYPAVGVIFYTKLQHVFLPIPLNTSMTWLEIILVLKRKCPSINLTYCQEMVAETLRFGSATARSRSVRPFVRIQEPCHPCRCTLFAKFLGGIPHLPPVGCRHLARVPRKLSITFRLKIRFIYREWLFFWN